MSEAVFGYRVMLDVAISDRGQFRVDPESPSETRGLANDRAALRVRAIRRGENVTLSHFSRPEVVGSVGLGMSTGEIVPTDRLGQLLDMWRLQSRRERKRLVEGADSVALVQIMSVHVQGPDPVHLQIDYPGGRTIIEGLVPLPIIATDTGGVAGAAGERSATEIVLIC